jgi:hypothetical protein
MEYSNKPKYGPDDAVRKILKDLPNVGTSNYFDEQLQRRITAERVGALEAGFLVRLLRMPSLVYSVAALVLICGLTFYVAYKTHTFDKNELHQIPSLSSDGPNESLSASGKEEIIMPLPPSGDRIPSAKEQEAIANRNTARVSGTGGGNDVASGRVEVSNTNATEGQMHMQGSEKGSAINEFHSEADKAMFPSKSSIKPPSAKGKSVEMMNDSKLRKVQSIQPEEIPLKATAIAPSASVDSIQMGKPVAPTLMRSMTAPLHSPKARFGMQSFHDSVGNRDSLLRDSLKRLGHMRDSSTIAPDSIKPF